MNALSRVTFLARRYGEIPKVAACVLFSSVRWYSQASLKKIHTEDQLRIVAQCMEVPRKYSIEFTGAKSFKVADTPLVFPTEKAAERVLAELREALRNQRKQLDKDENVLTLQQKDLDRVVLSKFNNYVKKAYNDLPYLVLALRANSLEPSLVKEKLGASLATDAAFFRANAGQRHFAKENKTETHCANKYDELLERAKQELGFPAPFITSISIRPAVQLPENEAHLHQILDAELGNNPFKLAAIQAIIQESKSLLLGLLLLLRNDVVSIDEAVEFARLEEVAQEHSWGTVEEYHGKCAIACRRWIQAAVIIARDSDTS